jgi:hypothetical protein
MWLQTDETIIRHIIETRIAEARLAAEYRRLAGERHELRRRWWLARGSRWLLGCLGTWLVAAGQRLQQASRPQGLSLERT